MYYTGIDGPVRIHFLAGLFVYINYWFTILKKPSIVDIWVLR